MHAEKTEPGVRQLPAERGGAALSPGEEEDGSAMADRLHRVAVRPVGGAQQPVLPRPLQSGGEKLDAGNAGDHARIAIFRQRQQKPCAGMEAAVPAEKNADSITVRFANRRRDCLRRDRLNLRLVFAVSIQQTL